MPQSPPLIPNRVSSWAALNDRQVNHKASKGELKRKLSDKTLEEGSERHVKLRIESIELEQEELKMENEGLRLEKIEQAIDTSKYQNMRSKNYKRIVSLGDDLWCERRKLRKMLEASGKVSLLTPDTDNAFAAALLRLYKDPETSRKRRSATQSAMRQESIKAYAAVPTPGDGIPAGYLRCSMTGEFDRPHRIHAAHIIPYCVGQELAAYLFGPDQSLRLNRPDNCLMMHEDIERAFDNGIITLFPVDPVSRPLLRWKIVLVNQDARNQLLKLDTVKTVGELDGRELTFRSEQRPASRFLYYHFVMSLLLCRSRDSHGWETVWLQYGKTKAWPTPGRYLRASMLSALARCVGGIDDAEVIELVKNHSFSSGQRLDSAEEDEIARRVVVAFEEDRVHREEAMEEEDEDEIDEDEIDEDV